MGGSGWARAYLADPIGPFGTCLHLVSRPAIPCLFFLIRRTIRVRRGLTDERFSHHTFLDALKPFMK